MIVDNRLLFSDAQNLAQAAGTYVSTNAFDNLAAQTAPGGFGTIRKDNFRALENMELLLQIMTTFTSGGAATLQFQVVQADDVALSSGVEVLQETVALALATLVQGYRPRLRIPTLGLTKRYWGLRYIIGTAAMTAGTVTAGLVPAVDSGLAVDA